MIIWLKSSLFSLLSFLFSPRLRTFLPKLLLILSIHIFLFTFWSHLLPFSSHNEEASRDYLARWHFGSCRSGYDISTISFGYQSCCCYCATRISHFQRQGSGFRSVLPGLAWEHCWYTCRIASLMTLSWHENQDYEDSKSDPNQEWMAKQGILL